jgi:hypothetical protein
MRLRFLALILVLLGACQREAPPPSEHAPEPSPLPSYRLAATWKRDGVEWHAIVVARELPPKELRRLARSLNAKDPRIFFDIYDDDARIAQLAAANGDETVMPDDWQQWQDQHGVGKIAGMVSTEGGALSITDMRLYDWRDQSSWRLKAPP